MTRCSTGSPTIEKACCCAAKNVLSPVVPVEDYDLLQRVKAAGQEWFWSERWQQMEREADEAIVAGRVERFDDMDSFFAGLDRAVARHSQE